MDTRGTILHASEKVSSLLAMDCNAIDHLVIYTDLRVTTYKKREKEEEFLVSHEIDKLIGTISFSGSLACPAEHPGQMNSECPR